MWKHWDELSVFFAEFVATLIMVMIGCMGCAAELESELHHSISSMNFAFIIMCVFQIFGYISGSFMNPAVTVAAYICQVVPLMHAAIYIFAQFAGGIAGFGLLTVLLPEEVFVKSNATGNLIGMCTAMPSPKITFVQALFIEFTITIILVLYWCSIWHSRHKKTKKYPESGCLIFGFVVAALGLAAGPWSGAGMNPARTLAPCLWNFDFQHQWIYFVGPFAAAIITPIVFQFIFAKWNEETKDEEDKDVVSDSLIAVS